MSRQTGLSYSSLARYEDYSEEEIEYLVYSVLKVMEKLVRSIPSSDIGGAPPVARETRDGRVIIVEIGYVLYFTEEYLDLAMCFNCCRFGHVAKYCKETVVCYRCGGEHDGRGYKEKKGRCVNCYRIGWNVSEHGGETVIVRPWERCW